MNKYKKAYIEINNDIFGLTITMIFKINGTNIMVRNVAPREISLDITLEYTYKKLINEVVKYLEERLPE